MINHGAYNYKYSSTLPEVGRVGANWVRPNAVNTAAMLVSCEKSKYNVWFNGNVVVLLSSVMLSCAVAVVMTWFCRRARTS